MKTGTMMMTMMMSTKSLEQNEQKENARIIGGMFYLYILGVLLLKWITRGVIWQ